jgi:hypothetical protein
MDLRAHIPALGVAARVSLQAPDNHLTIPSRQSLSKLTFFLSSFSDQDPFVFGTVLLGVEQHQVAAHGAFDPDGKGHVSLVILVNGEMVTVGGRPAFDQERGKAADAERVRRAADGTSPQAELLKCP